MSNETRHRLGKPPPLPPLPPPPPPPEPPGAAEYKRSSWAALTARLALRAIVNPGLARDLLRVVWAFRSRTWFRRLPFLPLPPREYIRWRMYTAYGSEDAVPPLEDVVRFARWRREVMHL